MLYFGENLGKSFKETDGVYVKHFETFFNYDKGAPIAPTNSIVWFWRFAPLTPTEVWMFPFFFKFAWYESEVLMTALRKIEFSWEIKTKNFLKSFYYKPQRFSKKIRRSELMIINKWINEDIKFLNILSQLSSLSIFNS